MFINNLKLKNKLIILCAVLLGLFLVMTEVIIIPMVDSNLKARSVDKMKSLVESSYSTVEYYYNQAHTGLISEDKAKEMTKSILGSLRYGGGNYFWINDYTPNMIMHPIKPELDGQNLSDYKDPNGLKIFVEFVKVVKSKGEGVVNYEWPKPGKEKPQPKMSYVKGFEPWHWVIGSGIYIDDLNAVKSSINNKIHLSAFIFIILMVGMILIIIIPLNKTINKLLKHLEKTARLDLSGSINIKQKDELGIIANAIDIMTNNLRGLISEVNELGDMVSEATQNMNISTQEIERMSENVTEATSKLASSSTMQTLSVDKSEEKIMEIIKSVEKISEVMRVSEELTKKSKMITSEGEKLVNGQKHQMQQSRNIVVGVTEVIGVLSNHSKEIGQIVETIKGIAEQTALLSLNASIEAARAGEQGKGFAIVAEEVNKLADQSGAAVKQIKYIVNEIITGIENTVKEVKLVDVAVGEQANSLVDTVLAFEEISANVLTIGDKVKEAKEATGLLEIAAKNAGEEIVNIAQLTQNSANSTQAVADSAEAQNESLQEISNSTKNLAALTEKLQDSIARFKL